MAISSADEFVALRTSKDPALYGRSVTESASLDVWLDVLTRYPDMKVWVIRNKTIPVEILEALATDPDPGVRYEVAGRRKAPANLLHRLAMDVDESVRMAVAMNKKCSQQTLHMLEHDPWENIRNAVADRLANDIAL